MTSTVDVLARDMAIAQTQVKQLRVQLSHTRFAQYTARRNILTRITEAERRYNALYSEFLMVEGAPEAQLYKPQASYQKSGYMINVELSLDGTYYANPAPKVPGGATVYVRVIIDEAHHGDTGIPRTHDMFHVVWRIPAGYTPLDTIPATGHDVYAVCWPLIITRKFHAPGSNTNKNWLADVDAYERLP